MKKSNNKFNLQFEQTNSPQNQQSRFYKQRPSTFIVPNKIRDAAADLKSPQYLTEQTIEEFSVPIQTTTAGAIIAPALPPLPVPRNPPPSKNIIHLQNSHSQKKGIENNNNNLQDDNDIFREQAKNAHYTFDSSVQDTINDHAHTREETR